MRNNKLYVFPGGLQEEKPFDSTVMFPNTVPVICRCKKCGNTFKFLVKGEVTASVLLTATEPFKYEIFRVLIDDTALRLAVYACAAFGYNDVGIHAVKLADNKCPDSVYLQEHIMHRFMDDLTSPLPPRERDVILGKNGKFVIGCKGTFDYITLSQMRGEILTKEEDDGLEAVD